MRKYPEHSDIISENLTLHTLVNQRCSIARFGDGECKLMLGVGHKYQEYDDDLAKMLRRIVSTQKKDLLVAIPRIDPRCPRAYWWEPWKEKFAPFLDGTMQYYSSFISRPDHAPWIAEDAGYKQSIEALWMGRKTVLVGSGRSLTCADLHLASDLGYIETSGRDDFHRLDEICDKVREFKPEVAIFCAGMLATCAAWKLHGTGIQVLDLGAIGEKKLWNIGAAIARGERKE